MQNRNIALCSILTIIIMAFGLSYTQAQPGEGGGNRGGFNREEMRNRWQKRMDDQLKKSLKVSDEEWTVIKPRITKVTELQRASRGGAMRAMWGRRRGNDNNTQVKLNPLQQASKNLQDTLDKEGSTPEQIKAKLEAYRTAKTNAANQLKAAQTQLREILTLNQEAQLVIMGMLD